MTPRRLYLLLTYLPPDDHLVRVIEAAEQHNRHAAQQRRLRERRDHYRRRATGRA